MVANNMRLDKFISKATELSRKESKKILHASEITVNDEVIKDPGLHIDIVDDEVMWAGEPLSVATGSRYILLYKPEGFECSLKAKEYPIVTELIAVPELDSLRIAGRLDVVTTGALLLSDVGKWLHRVTSPKHANAKVYELTLAEPMDIDAQTHAVKKVSEGILLEGDYEPTKPATLEFIDETHARLTLEQGKYHQVKRMMGYFGNKVVELHRASIGHIDLQGLEKGDSRFLTEDEVEKF